MEKVKKLPDTADFYYQLALKQKDNLLFYDAVLNINEAIYFDNKREEYYSLKAEILALNDDEVQSNELLFFIQRYFNIDKSISLASNFIRYNREDLIHHYFRKGIENAIELGAENEHSPSFLHRIIKDMSSDSYSGEQEPMEDLPSFNRYEEIVEVERENFINVKEKRETAQFAKMLTLMDNADYIGAIRASDKIAPSSKYYQDALELKMNIMFYIKDIKGAFLCAEKLSELAPSNVSMFKVYASLYDEVYNKDVSKRIEQKVNKALEILIAEAEYDEIFAIAKMFFETNAYLPCAKILETYIEENPVREETLLILAIAKFVLNEKKDAKKLLRRTYDLHGFWTCAPTIMEILFSDYEIDDYTDLLYMLPDKFAQAKVKSLVAKIKGVTKGYFVLEESYFIEQVLSLSKLTDAYTIKPVLDALVKAIGIPIFKKTLEILLISNLALWEDKKATVLQSILENACEQTVYYEGAMVADGIYSTLYLPLRIDIKDKDNKERYNNYYKQAILNILREDNEVDARLVAHIAQEVYNSFAKNGFNPKSDTCLIQIVCIIYKMTRDGDSFEGAKRYTENGLKCQLKTLKKYRDIIDLESFVRKFSKK